jgi:hypothetical protein
MFNWGWNNLCTLQSATANHPLMPAVKPVTVSNDGYTVGVNDEGSTVLKMTTNNNTVTLTMNDNATRQLIKLLEATLEEENA